MLLVGEGKTETRFGVVVGVIGVGDVGAVVELGRVVVGVGSVGDVVELGHGVVVVEIGQENSGCGGGRWLGFGCALRDGFFLKRPLRSLRSLSMLSLCLRGENVGVGGGGFGGETGTASLNLGGQSA